MVHQTAKNSHKVFLNIKMFLKLLRAYFDTFTPNLNMLARLFLLCFTTSHVAFLPSPHSYNSKQTWHVVYLSMIFIHAFSNTIIHAVAILQTESAKVETAPTPLSTSRLPPSRSPSFLSGHLLPFSLFPFCVFVF